MPRRPAHIEAAAPRPRGRAALWAEIRRQRCFTAITLARETRMDPSSVRPYLSGLEAAGYIARDGFAGNAMAWRLVKDAGVDAPRLRADGSRVTQGAARANMWRTMRALKGAWSPRDLAIHASTPACPVHETDAKAYCHYLAKAGYLRAEHERRGRKIVRTRYRFVPARWSGPQPPMVQRIRQVFDPNLGEVVWPIVPEGPSEREVPSTGEMPDASSSGSGETP